MSIKLAGDLSGNVAEVDSNKNLKVTNPTIASQSGYVSVTAMADDGTYTGAKEMRNLRISPDGKVRVSIESLLFNETFQGSTLNSAQWNSNVTTMTVTTAGGFLVLNSGLSTASGAVARVQSYRNHQYAGVGSLNIEILVQLAQTPVANNIIEWGIGNATGTTAPTDGIFFRLNSGGALECVLCFNSSETVMTVNYPFQANVTYKTIIQILEDVVVFRINNDTAARIDIPPAGAIPSASNALPILLRTYNVVLTGSAQQLRVSLVGTSMSDMLPGKDWAHTKSGMGLMGYQGQTGNTMGTTALYTNSLAPGAGAVMTNTTAALGSGLGGQFSALPTLAANTDGIISSYQNPLGTALIPAKTLYVTGVRVQGAVTTVLAGNATPVVYAYSLAFGHTNVSLATTEAATSKAPRRVAIGYETYAAAAAVGTIGTGVTMQFISPIVVNPGEFIQLIGKNVGVVTTTGVITFLVTFDCYWE